MDIYQAIGLVIGTMILTGIGSGLPVVGPLIVAIRAALKLGGSSVPFDESKPITGRPILDLLAKAALKQYKDQPVIVALIVQFAKQVDKMLDEAGVPEVPINVEPVPPKGGE